MKLPTRRTSTVVVWKYRHISSVYDIIVLFFLFVCINTARLGTVDELPSVTKLHDEITAVAACTVDLFHFATVIAKLFSPIVKAVDVFRDDKMAAQIVLLIKVFRLDVRVVHTWTVPPSHSHQCYHCLLLE